LIFNQNQLSTNSRKQHERAQLSLLEGENMSVYTKETYDIFVKQLLFFAQIIAASTALTKLQGERRQ